MTITIDNKEILVEKTKAYLLEEFLNSLEETDLSQEEKDANVVLAQRKMQADAANIATLIYKVYGLE
jgi:UDP-N-acetylglucosamine enolpyruvyl transferase